MNIRAHWVRFALGLSLLSATGWLSACASTNANNAQAQARVHTELAARYYQAGQVAVAVQEAQIALDSDAGYVPGHTLLALIYAQLRQNAQADAHFRQALSLSEAQRLPTSDLRNSYAWYLCQTDRMAQGLNELSPVLRDPLYGSLDKALVNASVCAARLEQYELADSYVNAALAMRPDFATAYLYRGHLAVQKSQWRAAQADWQMTQKLLGDALETPETLWLLARIEHGSSSHRTGAAERLQKQFPASQEAKWLRAEQWQWF
jgi:type IV pilus assembly protein PilF